MPVLTILRLGFSGLLIAVFVYALIEAQGYPNPQASIYPLVIASAGLVLALATLVIDARRWRMKGSAVGGDASATASTAAYEPGSPIGYVFGRAGRYGLWMLAYFALMFVIGLVAAAAVFVTAFLYIEASVKLRYLWLAPVAIVALLVFLANAVNLFWPRALLPLFS